MDDETLRAEAGALVREQLDALGPVNPLAIEEHEEETKRLSFLTTQRDDPQLREELASAGDSRDRHDSARDPLPSDVRPGAGEFPEHLHDAVRRRRVRSAPGKPGKPLEGDIEIHASPRGKRTQRIHLLSSGEKALVAPLSPVRNIPHQAEPVLPARRSGCAARRSEHPDTLSACSTASRPRRSSS